MELLIYIITTVIFIIPLWKICSKIGRHPGLSLLSIIPYVGVMALALLLAFGRWPSLDRLPAPGQGA